jgi:uncharacterized protein YdeI (YjbR/CyaY-like superfamily)
METSARIDAYIAKAAPFAQPALNKLRKLIHKAVPGVEETIKWGFPHFLYNGEILCSFAAFKAHYVFGFRKAKIMDDPDGILELEEKTAMGSLGKMSTLSDLPADRIMVKYLKHAASLNAIGAKVPPPVRRPAKPVVVPDYFMAALKKNRKVLTAFEQLPPSHRREYVEYVTEAKREETRLRRLGKVREQLEKASERSLR